MRILVLYCHPVESSFNSALHQAVVKTLTEQGHEVDDCDLYAEGFNPALSREELLAYADTSRNQIAIKPYIERLIRAEGLVMVFPVWNFGLPAMLKGFIDRVFVPGVSFDMSDPRRIQPGLTHLRRVSGVTTYGVPRWKAFLLGDSARATVLKFCKRLTGGRATVTYDAYYGMNTASRDDLARFMQRIQAVMADFR